MTTKKPSRHIRSVGDVAVLPKPSFLKSKVVWFAGAVGMVALVLTNVNSILSNIRELPKEWRLTIGQFYGWYGDFPSWKGHWSNNPEGIVNIADLNLTSQPLHLSINDTANGQISGWIESQQICDGIPYFDTLQVSGNIKSSRYAEVVVFDFIGGFRKDFGKLKLLRDNGTMMVVAVSDPIGIFPKNAKIGLHPDSLIDEAEIGNFCPDKKMQMLQRAIQKAGERKAAE